MRHKGEPEAGDFLTSFVILHNVDSESLMRSQTRERSKHLLAISTRRNWVQAFVSFSLEVSQPVSLSLHHHNTLAIFGQVSYTH